MTDLRKAAEQNITYCVYPHCLTAGGCNGRCSKPLYKVSPKREWVGLTDDDKQEAFDETQEASGGFWEFAEYLEAKLKEKNT